MNASCCERRAPARQPAWYVGSPAESVGGRLLLWRNRPKYGGGKKIEMHRNQELPPFCFLAMVWGL